MKLLIALGLLLFSLTSTQAWELTQVGRFVEIVKQARQESDEFKLVLCKSEIGWFSKSSTNRTGRRVFRVIVFLPNAQERDEEGVASSEMEFDFDDERKAEKFYKALLVTIQTE
ncbi:MAG: hypothetical protein CMO80_03145 [Verrucomicrobiales bacterium]|mgnify:CR=1 FL=1|nr:hypothetical protein [Verrucomicrobiales bacterium]|tara:strand:+ start:1138 stop:1479 length:342 start_codon:yes stop_codon:yes gene_type:complete